ncbi:MAG: FAD-binding protein [Chloroflexota bacterium]
MDIKWDKETDVVVVGYGLAGAVTAVEASDAGAAVTILEKSGHPGGCSILSGGGVTCARDVSAATDYLTVTSGGRVGESLVRAYARDMVANEAYLRKLAQVSQAMVKADIEAGGGGKAALGRGYPFPGRETFYRARVAEIPGFNGFPWVQRLNPAGVNLMKVALDNVACRRIEVGLATPGRRLVTDAAGAVTGIVAESQGRELAIRARRAVVLACGGFEQNRWMLQQYLQGQPFYSMAPLTHTGDGVVMAQKVGAALWHMGHVHASYGFKFPEFPIAFRHIVGGPRNPRRVMPWVVVDKYGRRYMNEYPLMPQDTAHRAMEIFDPDMPGYPRIPSYIVFDEAGRKRGPMAAPLSSGDQVYQWSQDNRAEISKGWILQAGGIDDLALKVRETAEDEGKMDGGVLAATIAVWNEMVAAGKDLFHRLAGTMAAIGEAPFYAVPVWPVITNTQGGPQHDEGQRVIDAFGQPIPRLYAAGELGSFWGHLYLLGSNLSECFSSGRNAGRNAAGEPSR